MPVQVERTEKQVQVKFESGVLVQSPLPIAWHAAGGSWHWLIERVMPRRDQLGSLEELLGRKVPEPIFARLVTLNDLMSCVDRVVTCVLGRG